MANKIGSNFLLPAKAFLDKRQEVYKKVSDLGTWNYEKYPIPIGFEVFVENKWYTYYGDTVDKDPITGYFRIRGGINVLQSTGTSENDVMSQAAVTNALNGLNGRIQDIISNLGTVLEIRMLDYKSENPKESSGGLFESGTNVLPVFTWEVWYNGNRLRTNEIDPPIIYKNGVSTGKSAIITGKEHEDDTFGYSWAWYYGSEISSDTTFTISISYNGDSVSTGTIGLISVSQDITYEFIKPKLWGRSESGNVDDIIKLTNQEKEVSKGRGIKLNNINCKIPGTEKASYIYYMIPTELYSEIIAEGIDNTPPDPIKLLVGNMECNAIEEYFGKLSGTYTVIVFQWPQTGILNIEFI